MRGSSRAAKSITAPGTRKPATSSSTSASGWPRWVIDSAQDEVAHGVVAWARSPSTVTEPVLARRPTARSCMGDRSCASSRITWPRLGVRLIRSAVSSIKITSASDQRAEPTLRAGLPHQDQLSVLPA